MQVCGRDPLRDEALVYGNILQESGVAVKIDEYVSIRLRIRYLGPGLNV